MRAPRVGPALAAAAALALGAALGGAAARAHREARLVAALHHGDGRELALVARSLDAQAPSRRIKRTLAALPPARLDDLVTAIAAHEPGAFAHLPDAIRDRWLAAAARADDELGRADLAALLDATPPGTADPARLAAAVVRRLADADARGDAPESRRLLDATLGALGRAQVHHLAAPADAATLAPAVRETIDLALSWSTVAAPPADPRTPAALVRAARHGAATDALIARGTAAGGAALADLLLRVATAPDAMVHLRARADAGDAVARAALRARDPALERADASACVGDPRLPIAQRRLAAWRLRTLDRDALTVVLADPPEDGAGGVVLTALVAERHHDRAAAGALAQAWQHDLSDARKRAGLLLHLLLGDDRPPELRAAVETDAATAQLRAIASHPAAALDRLEERVRARLPALPPAERLEAIAALLARGRTAVVPDLLVALRETDPAVLRAADALVERLRPEWHAAAGRPLADDPTILALQADLLLARGRLERRAEPGERGER